jgi:hypothetical protein
MDTPDIKYVFVQLGYLIRGYLLRLGLTQGIWQEFKDAAAQSTANNAWYTEHSIRQALDAIAYEMLAPDKFKAWLAGYHIENKTSRNVGIIMAGNLPLVGFHDLLCVVCSGHTAVVKLSHKDPFLLPMLKRQMVKMDYHFENKIIFTDSICAEDVDAVIAAGSDTAVAVFEEQYGHLPHILRHSKTSAAVLHGNETTQQLQGLAHDILDYFGLGCRSVAKLFVPQDYNFDELQHILSEFRFDNQNFADAYRYARAVCITKGESMIDCGCCLLQGKEAIYPPVAQAFFEYYHDESDLLCKLQRHQNRLQCLCSIQPISGFERFYTPFGTTQRPQLSDYADGVDVMKWLQKTS